MTNCKMLLNICIWIIIPTAYIYLSINVCLNSDSNIITISAGFKYQMFHFNAKTRFGLVWFTVCENGIFIRINVSMSVLRDYDLPNQTKDYLFHLSKLHRKAHFTISILVAFCSSHSLLSSFASPFFRLIFLNPYNIIFIL